MRKAYRVGIRSNNWFFPNAGIFVVHLSSSAAIDIGNAMQAIKSVLISIGRFDISDAFVFEPR